ncbi:MAG: C40 family peptidase [Lachnospiraceae bacterium]|nr:C40 family peptidase [Lachnospiraceae bacterium]
MPVSAGFLPTVGAGASLEVASVTEVASAQEAAVSVKTDVTTVDVSSFLPSAGVEAAAAITQAPKSVAKEAAAPVKEAAPATIAEIPTDDQPAAVQTEAPVADQAPADVLATVPASSETTETAAAADGETTVEVPEDIAAAGVSETSVKTVSGADAAASSVKEQYKNLVIAKCNDYVNVRKEPNEEAEILGKLYNESVGDFVSEAEGGWVEIISGTVRGYVKAEYVVTGDAAVQRAKEVGKRLAHVNTTTLYVRESASTEASVVGMVPIDDDLSVTEEDGNGWVKVSVEEGEGYVSTDYVTLKTEFTKAESKAEEEARLAKEKAEREAALAAAQKKAGKKKKGSGGGGGGSYAAPSGGGGAAVANYALQFVGNPYVYGGSSLTNGTDCSGFVMSVYAAFGVGLPHSSGAQRSCGTDVGGLGNAQPGDIVCYSGHVGIYIGGGQIVHASTAKTGIKVSNAGYRSVLSVRRIF